MADEADDVDLDVRIKRGDRMAGYDAIGQAIEELNAWRDALGEVLCDAETMQRVAALNQRNRRTQC